MTKATNTDCLSAEEMRQYLHGQLSAHREAAVEAHVLNCATCAVLTEEWEADNETLIAEIRQCTREFPDLLATCREAIDRVVELGETLVAPELARDLHRDEETPPPKQIGEYELLELLGEGGMGRVYLARHRKLTSLRAVKLLSTRFMHDELAVARFQREMEAVGKLAHRHIVTAHDAGEAAGVHFLVMEFVDGADLGSLIKRHGSLPIEAACEVGRQIALALDHLHRNGLVHRDVKPSNVLVGREGVVKLADLGLALMRSLAEETPFTRRGVNRRCEGTVGYIAPEQQAFSHHVDIRADIFSLGTTLRRAMIGREAGDDSDHEVWSILARMTAPDREQRFATPWDVVRALTPWASAESLWHWLATHAPTKFPPESQDDSPTRTFFRKARHGGWTWGVGLVLLLVAGGWLSHPWWATQRELPAKPNQPVATASRTQSVSAAPVKASGKKVGTNSTEMSAAAQARAETYRWMQLSTETDAPAKTPTWLPGEFDEAGTGLIPRPAKVSLGPWQLDTIAPATITFSLSWHPDGKRFACGSDDRTVRVFDAKSRQLLQSFTMPYVYPARDFVTFVEYSSDGEFLAANGVDRVHVWTNKGEAATDCPTAWGVHRFAWHPHEHRLAIGGRDELFVRDYPNGRELRLAGHAGLVASLGWSRDGGWLASGSDDGGVRLWDLSRPPNGTGAIDAVLTLQGHKGTVMGVAWNPRQELLASCGHDGCVRVWEIQSTDQVTNAHVQMVSDPRTGKLAYCGHALAWNHDGTLLAGGCQKGVALIWSVKGEIVTTLRGHVESVSALAWSSHGPLVTGGYDGTLRLWNADGTEAGIVARSGARLHSVEYCSKHDLLAVGGWDGTVRTFTSNGRLVEARRVFAEGIAHALPVAWNADRNCLAVSGRSPNGTAAIYVFEGAVSDDLRRLKIQHNIYAPRAALHALTWHPRHPVLAASNHAGLIHVWHGRTKLIEIDTKIPGLNRLTWSHDGKCLIFGTSDNRGSNLHVWNVADALKNSDFQPTVVPWNAPAATSGLVWSPARQNLFAAHVTGSVTRWSAEGRELSSWPIGTLIHNLAASPDQRHLAIGSSIQGVQTFSVDAPRARPLRTGHKGPVTALSWHSDNRRLFTVGFDGTLRSTDTSTGECEWLVVCLPDGHCARYSPAGELLESTTELGPHLFYRDFKTAIPWRSLEDASHGRSPLD